MFLSAFYGETWEDMGLDQQEDPAKQEMLRFEGYGSFILFKLQYFGAF